MCLLRPTVDETLTRLQHFVPLPHVPIETAGPQQRRTRGPRAAPTLVHSYFIRRALQTIALLIKVAPLLIKPG